MPVKMVSFKELLLKILYASLFYYALKIINLIPLNNLDSEELYPVASSTSFFTDMHHLLKVMSIGNVRSACHHRLRFLEEVIFITNLL